MDYEKILDLVKKNNIYLIEDVCESHGATFNNKSLGHMDIFQIFLLLRTPYVNN